MNVGIPLKLEDVGKADRRSIPLDTAIPHNAQLSRLSQSVFRIVTESSDLHQRGSGVLIDERGTALTAWHVLTVDSGRRWQAPYAVVRPRGFAPGGERELPIQVRAYSEDLDLALVSLPSAYRYRPATFAPRPLRTGDHVFGIGFPGSDKQVAAGQVLTPVPPEAIRPIRTADDLTVGAALVHRRVFGGSVVTGNIVSTNYTAGGGSGGGLFDSFGRLGGIVTAFKELTSVTAEVVSEVCGVDLDRLGPPARLSIARSLAQVRRAFPALFAHLTIGSSSAHGCEPRRRAAR